MKIHISDEDSHKYNNTLKNNTDRLINIIKTRDNVEKAVEYVISRLKNECQGLINKVAKGLKIVDVENILSNVPDHFTVVFQHVDGYEMTYSNVSHGSLDTIIFLETFNAPVIVRDLELITSQVPEDRYISFYCSNRPVILTNYEYNDTCITLFFKDEQ